MRKKNTGVLFFFGIISFSINACVSPKIDKERVYLGVAAISERDRQIATILIRNALEPIGLERKILYYLHVEDLGKNKSYYTVWADKPEPQHFINRLDQALIKDIYTPKKARPEAIIVGLRRIRTIINQDKTGGKIRAWILLSGFDLSKLTSSQLKEVETVASEINAQRNRISILCIIGMDGTPSRAKFAGLFSSMSDKIVITSMKYNQQSNQCLRK
ncbi:MAG: hypothetical protein QNJ63_14745 [Calothrix sp. MO_192.B10]|nr:hypothetical protein [Calothrix sp. MO_192.B10]